MTDNILENASIEAIVADSDIEVRQNLLLTNARARYAKYVNCRGQQIVWQPSDTTDDEGNVFTPVFENCIFQGCSFEELPENAVIEFIGKCVFYDCDFRATQKIKIDSDCEFYHCSNVNIVFATARTYKLKVVNSSVAFPEITASNWSTYPLRLDMNGGELELPAVTTYADWILNISGARVNTAADTAIHTGLYMDGCVFQGKNNLYSAKAMGCTLCFNGSASSSIILQGLVYIGNEIKNGTLDSNLTNKTGVTFNGDIDIGNRVNMANRTMTRGSAAKVVSGNYNGSETL